VPFHVLRALGEEMIVKFDDAPAVRRALIARLFDGEYAQELEHVSVSRVLTTMVRRLLRGVSVVPWIRAYPARHADRFAFASVDRVEQRVPNQVGDAGLMLLVG
jgi:hypothetical protein